jgi:hypothetical protein
MFSQKPEKATVSFGSVQKWTAGQPINLIETGLWIKPVFACIGHETFHLVA